MNIRELQCGKMIICTVQSDNQKFARCSLQIETACLLLYTSYLLLWEKDEVDSTDAENEVIRKLAPDSTLLLLFESVLASLDNDFLRSDSELIVTELSSYWQLEVYYEYERMWLLMSAAVCRSKTLGSSRSHTFVSTPSGTRYCPSTVTFACDWRSRSIR